MNIYQFIKENLDQNSVFFEIGSHFGLDTNEFLKITDNLHCFEPDPRNIKMFKHLNLSVKLNEFAISNIDGQTQFYLSSGDVYESKYGPTNQDIVNKNDWSLSSSIKKPKNHLNETPWVKFNSVISVETKRLDTYCKENNISKIDFIWMDVQGAELDVIIGMGEFKKNIRYLYSEYSDKELYENQPNKNEIINELGKNWVIIHDFGGDILLKNNGYLLS
jgi:FkbM family methyltransferase